MNARNERGFRFTDMEAGKKSNMMVGVGLGHKGGAIKLHSESGINYNVTVYTAASVEREIQSSKGKAYSK